MKRFVLTMPSRYTSVKVVGAYVIIHVPTQRAYVGSTIDMYARRQNHLSLLRRGKHYCRELQVAYFQSPMIEFKCCLTSTIEDAQKIEQEILDKYLPMGVLFNDGPNAAFSSSGVTWTDKRRAKTIQMLTGRKLTSEHIEKVRKSNAGRKRSGQALENIRAAVKRSISGKKHSFERIERNRQAQLARNYRHSPEALVKISLANKGRKQSPEHVAKKSKSVEIDGVFYPSLIEASRSLGIPLSTLSYRFRKKENI